MHFVETIVLKSNNKTTKFIETTLILRPLSKPSVEKNNGQKEYW